jgi:hypothetical protein
MTATARRSRSALQPWVYGSPDRTEVAQAEWACGETYRFDPPGMPNCCIRRGPPAPGPHGLITTNYPPICPWAMIHRAIVGPASTSARCSADPWRTSPSIWADVFSRNSEVKSQKYPNPKDEFVLVPILERPCLFGPGPSTPTHATTRPIACVHGEEMSLTLSDNGSVDSRLPNPVHTLRSLGRRNVLQEQLGG